jgi:hypothetical protein
MKEIFMIKRCGVVFSLAFFVCFTACAQQKANDPSDFNIEDHGTWIEITGYRGTSRTVVIPNRINGKSVTGIGVGAFVGQFDYDTETFKGNLTSVIIPNSVTEIGEFAFIGNQLTNITIPNSVTEIGESAFQGNQLTRITIPNSVTKIGANAFRNNQLTSITIPNSVTEIGALAFRGNPLTNFSLASGNTAYTIKDSFLLSKDEKIVFMHIGNEKDITIPNGVIEIASYAFTDKQLTSVTIPNGVTTIGGGAFSDNQLTSVTIPKSVTDIKGQYTFDATTLTSITFEGNNVDIFYYAFNQDGRNRGELVYEYSRGKAGTYKRNGKTWTKQ